MTSITNNFKWPLFLNDVSYEWDNRHNVYTSYSIGVLFADAGDFCLAPLRVAAEHLTGESKTYTIRFCADGQITTAREKVNDADLNWYETALLVVAVVLVTIPGIILKAVSMLDSEVKYKHKYVVGACSPDERDRMKAAAFVRLKTN